MKKIFLPVIVIIALFAIENGIGQQPHYDPTVVEMSRMFSKDIFELNGVPYMQPMVEAVNATSNSRFFSSAFVPVKVDKPYFRISLNAMGGIVPDNKKTYQPQLPAEELTFNGLIDGGYAKLNLDPNNPFIIQDTAGLVYYALKGMIYNGLYKDGTLKQYIPEKSATILGTTSPAIMLPDSVLQSLFHNLSVNVPYVGNVNIYDKLPPESQRQIDSLLILFPQYFTLPSGSDMSMIFAGVPQLEIGSLWGTEALIRFIPPVHMSREIGDFAFWGFGLKHSISQYFNKSDETSDRLFDLAVQAVYQGTHLKNTIGVTNSELTADATIWNFNIHASKSFENIIDIYTGISFEFVNIKSNFKYYLPVEVQAQLGLRELRIYKDENGNETGREIMSPDPPEYPGDTSPQTAVINLSDSNIKWVGGIARDFGDFRVFMDYSISKFNIFSGGIQYTFNK